MKKTLFAVLAALSLFIGTFTAAADTGLNPVNYYNQYSTDWTLEVPTLGSVTLTDFIIPYGLRQQKVACYYPRKMCYVFADALRGFGFDGDLFQKWQEEVTGKKVQFIDLLKAIK